MKFLKFWFPVALYCGIIFGASAVPSVEMPPAIPHLDKFVHALEYAVLAVLFARAVHHTNPNAWLLLVWTTAVFFVAFYGITDEFHQSFVVGRSSDLQDWMFDTIGGMVGAAVYLSFKNKSNRNASRG